MSFVYAVGLLVAFLVAAPYFAHRLRRRRGEERAFAAAHLVPPAPPRARRRSKLEDRALFATRGLSILALALLGASPLVRCSRLALQRSSGASVAIALVVDDSMSMRAATSGKSRFELAREGARELLSSTREGDAVAIVLAGAPARVALAATTDLTAARAAVEALAESDRATDLDGALSMAHALIAELPQVDRRIVVLSDLADGHPDAPPVGEGSDMATWVAMPELREAAHDCAILSADRTGDRVRVKVACSDGVPAAGRQISLVDGARVLVRGPAEDSASQGSSARGLRTTETTLVLPPAGDAGTDVSPGTSLVARLEGTDSIGADDRAPVVAFAEPGAIAVVADVADESAATGGAPVVEQALAALSLDIGVRPIPSLPDRSEDLAPFAGIIIDDPPGFTPEQRRALGAFIDAGKLALVALGPRAATAQLGASLEPVLGRPLTWSPTASPGADVSSATGPLVESAPSLSDVSSKSRAVVSPDDVPAFDALLKWTDGALFVGRRAVGKGEAWIVTLPFALDTSDLPLRPAFLALLDAWAREARSRAAPRRTDVGMAWTFAGAKSVVVVGPAGRVPVTTDEKAVRTAPPLIGGYTVTVDGKDERRVAAPVAGELDLRPRRAAQGASGGGLGDSHAAVDASPVMALILLALVSGEIALRLRAKARADRAEAA